VPAARLLADEPVTHKYGHAFCSASWFMVPGDSSSKMTNLTDPELQYLIHFFTDRAHLFKTVTMADSSQVDEISDKISSQKGWYWIRYSPTDRQDYLRRRLFVERKLYDEYTQEYGRLKEKVPVYFYLRPNITRQKAMELGQQRTNHAESMPHILMLKIQDIDDTVNMTFTLNDSFTAYWKKAIEAGIKCRPEEKDRVVLPDHNKVFPFSMIEQIHQKYRAQPIVYEVQVWDYELLERMSYVILAEE
jgi:hypothetical protein